MRSTNRNELLITIRYELNANGSGRSPGDESSRTTVGHRALLAFAPLLQNRIQLGDLPTIKLVEPRNGSPVRESKLPIPTMPAAHSSGARS